MFSIALPRFHFGVPRECPGCYRGFGDTMRARITKRLVAGLKSTGTDYYVFDTDTIGFAARA